MISEKEIYIPDNFIVDEVEKFRQNINKYIDDGTINFIFNFERCSFIDSTGLGTIVSVYKKCVEKNGDIVLKSMKPDVLKLFKMTRLNKVFKII
ncbi:STAS domain-containing protein [Clostridium sp. BJN0001]|uniref:STAS domain-containing protein n=1 Tax=Clostridium sp. BJN0001 TaxID=2930219 RepID=UPI001FD284A7|nr:STAS domain-containing protein [Clostridium sp. BJN0001]